MSCCTQQRRLEFHDFLLFLAWLTTPPCAPVNVEGSKMSISVSTAAKSFARTHGILRAEDAYSLTITQIKKQNSLLP